MLSSKILRLPIICAICYSYEQFAKCSQRMKQQTTTKKRKKSGDNRASQRGKKKKKGDNQACSLIEKDHKQRKRKKRKKKVPTKLHNRKNTNSKIEKKTTPQPAMNRGAKTTFRPSVRRRLPSFRQKGYWRKRKFGGGHGREGKLFRGMWGK
jgi:hypothetical protein